MRPPEIQPLTADRLDDALVLSSTAGWNQRLADWRLLLRLAPRGCFAAWADRRVVGTAIGIDYGGFGWIAMMLVDPAWRGQGLGRRLLEAAMAVLPADRTIRLDATPLGRPLYLSAGFADEAALSRTVRSGGGPAPAPSDSARRVRPVTPGDLDAIAAYDHGVFGGDRRQIFAWARHDAPQYAWVCDGDPLQYCLGRKGRLFDEIGPVVATSDETAQTLVAAALRGAGSEAVTVDAVDAHPAFGCWLAAAGFAVQRPLFRMWRPPADGTTRPFARRPLPLAERAILGPEFA